VIEAAVFADDYDDVLDWRTGALFVLVLILTSLNRAGQWTPNSKLKESQARDANSQAMERT
jgi:hypothetical protein